MIPTRFVYACAQFIGFGTKSTLAEILRIEFYKLLLHCYKWSKWWDLTCIHIIIRYTPIWMTSFMLSFVG